MQRQSEIKRAIAQAKCDDIEAMKKGYKWAVECLDKANWHEWVEYAKGKKPTKPLYGNADTQFVIYELGKPKPIVKVKNTTNYKKYKNAKTQLLAKQQYLKKGCNWFVVNGLEMVSSVCDWLLPNIYSVNGTNFYDKKTNLEVFGIENIEKC